MIENLMSARPIKFKEENSLFQNKNFWISLIIWMMGLFMAWISWLKWPDLIIDYGEQLYIAWRLSEGEVLYKDINYFYGPLSSYLHAILFKLFGANFLIIISFNLFLIALTTWLIFRIFSSIGTHTSALFSSLIFVTVFAFSQYLWMGNHNFVCSYVYDITHGIFLTLASIYQLTELIKNQKTKNLFFLGFLTGLVFLTKFEVALAWGITVITILSYYFYHHVPVQKSKIREVLIFILSSLLPLAIFFFYFSFHYSFTEAFLTLLKPWTYAFNPSIRDLPFYKSVMGINQLKENILINVKFAGLGAALILVLVFFNYTLLKKKINNFSHFGFSVIFLLGFYFLFFNTIPWLEILRPVPLILFSAILFFLIKYHKETNSNRKILLPLIAFSLFSLLLLIKIIFKTHVYHYGAALALPGTLILAKLLIDEIPTWIKKRRINNLFLKTSIYGMLVLFIFAHIKISYSYYDKKILPVNQNEDLLIGYSPYITPRDMNFKIALSYIEETIEPDQEFYSFPTGTLLNFLAKRKNSNPNISFNPGTWKLVGENIILDSLKDSPPHFIVIVFHDYLEFKYRFFGVDFGQNIYQWINENYQSIHQIGHHPVEDKKEGIVIFKNKSLLPRENKSMELPRA